MKATWKIICKNTFTLFNLVNLILAAMVAFVGSYKNMLFIFVAIGNTLISIINELRAHKIIEQMKLISEQKPTIKRGGKNLQISPEEVQKNDILILGLGDQILFDSILDSGQLEVNESFITGEQDNIVKKPGDKLISGSFVVAGSAEAKVTSTSEDSFVNKLQQEAKQVKTADSKLFSLMNKIVKYISIALIPIGALLLWARFRTEADTATAITSTVAALINMIPEGLILLTSSVLALATIRLSIQKGLVQDLYSIETLARVDCICLDKTGTLTTGNMTVQDFILADGTVLQTPSKAPTQSEKSFLRALRAILDNQMSENATTSALKKKFLKTPNKGLTDDFPKIIETIAFSSDRKYSGIKTKNADYLMGAVDFITDNKEDIKKVKSMSGEYRVIAVVERSVDTNTVLLGFIRLKDEIRGDASNIINYFYDNDVAVKIISGDDLATVTNIARTVGVKDLRGIDLSTETKHNYAKLVKENSIFTRVKPAEKKQLIHALKKQGYTVAMTGDGVNDILAMKEADVSLAIGDGADAARRSAKMVLLNSDYSAVPSIIDEGRQSINNLERSTSLFLAKTVYASILAVVFVVLPLSYPYSPIEMTLLNFACIGFPGLALALEKNTSRPKNLFIHNIRKYSIPTGITISIAMIILSIIASVANFPHSRLITISAIITFVIDYILIYMLSRPLNLYRRILMGIILAIPITIALVPPLAAFFEFAL